MWQFFGTLLANPHKFKDMDNARRDLKNLGIKPELYLYERGNKLMKPLQSTLFQKQIVKIFAGSSDQ